MIGWVSVFVDDVLKASIDVSAKTKMFLNMTQILLAGLHMSMSPRADGWKLHKRQAWLITLVP